MDALNRHRQCFCLFYPTPLVKYLTVCSEEGQDCRKVRVEAAGSFIAMDLNNMNTINGDYSGNVDAEHDLYMPFIHDSFGHVD